MKAIKTFCKEAVKLGVKDARVISTKTIITAPWVKMKCQYGCDSYGECLTCPPYSPTPEETREIIGSYKEAILVKGDEHIDVSTIAQKLERLLFLEGYYKAWAMGAGPCRLCSACSIKQGCRHPYEARPSMEACGIDVFQTARNNGFTIKVLRSCREKGNYFGLVFVK